MMLKNKATPMIGLIISGCGILASVVFLSLDHRILFWISLCVVALYYITGQLLLSCARRGFSKRVNALRTNLLHSRTLEKKLKGNNSTEPIEKDDVDVLIAQLLLGTTEDIPSWSITDIDQINDLKTIIQENPDRLDPDAQPTWLCLISTLLFIGCPILLVLALIMRIAR
jgi:hypothetical protein